jgi:uncharacterized protein with FMN-binding domain
MNRAIPAAIITAVGLGALASFKSTSGLPAKSAAAIVVPRTTVPATAAPPPTHGSSPATTPATVAPPTAPAATTPPTAAPGPGPTVAQSRTIMGDPVDNQYGTVQLRVTLQGSRITDIVATQMPDSHRRSLEISQQAEPLLQQEALQAQSAQINIISGATFTSDSYAQSLQSALDRSHG